MSPAGPAPNGERLQGSLSGYYYTGAGTYFTATLSVVGVFLIIYRLGDIALERLVTTLAGVAALGVAFFHTAPAQAPTPRTAASGAIPPGMRRHLLRTAWIDIALGLYQEPILRRAPTPPHPVVQSMWGLDLDSRPCGPSII